MKKVDIIVRGMKEKYFLDHFKNMEVYFGGDARGIPSVDSDYLAFYLEAPDSAITHIGVVKKIDRTKPGEVTFYLKAIIHLDKPITVDHAVRKQEYSTWTFEKLGIKNIGLIYNDFTKLNITSLKI